MNLTYIINETLKCGVLQNGGAGGVSFFTNINNHNHNLQNITIKLNNNEVKFINRIIQREPTIFNDIIINQDITVADIPKIIFVTSNIYKEKLIGSGDINVDIINLIQYTIIAILSTLSIPQPEMIIFIDILNYSIELLKTNLPYIEKEEHNLYIYFSKCFHNIFVSLRDCCCCCFYHTNAPNVPNAPTNTNRREII